MKKRNLVLFGTTAMLSLAIAGTIGAVTASAATITNPSTTGQTTVSYQQDSSWTVSIPDSLTVNASDQQITVSSANTPNGFTITVNSAHEFKLTNEAGASIDYQLKIAETGEGLGEGTVVHQGGTVLTVSEGNEQSASTYIGAYVSGSPATGENPATDTLTFTIAETPAD